MRVLVIADDAEVRAACAGHLDRAGHEVSATSEAARATERVRSTRPEALLVVASGATSALRLLLGRLRDAAEAPLPALLLLDAASLWLRAPLPADLAPAVAIAARDADAPRITAALAALLDGAPRVTSTALGGVTFERVRRRLIAGNASGAPAEVGLTPSEAAVLGLLVAQPGAFVAAGDIAHALWGTPLADRYARGAIQTHVHTLRGKLGAAGFLGAVESKTGVGYRLTLESAR